MANVYYSIGQNTTDHKTGSPNCTISSGVMTFTVAQIDDQLGVGDRVTYDTSSIAYLASKISTTQWNVVTKVGAAPSDEGTEVTVNSIAHEYTSLSAAESGAQDSNHLNTQNLSGNSYTLNFPCYNDSGPDTSRVDYFGWTTSETYRINVYTPTDTTTECNSNQRHDGTENSNFYCDPSTNGTIIAVRSSYVSIIGLGLYDMNASGNGNSAVLVNGGGSGKTGVIIDGCYVSQMDSGSYSTAGINFFNQVSGCIRNNCLYDIGSAENPIQTNYNSGQSIWCYNNSVAGGGTSYGFANSASGSTVYCYNNVTVECSGNEYIGTFSATANTNASHDGTAPNTGEISLSSDTTTDYYIANGNFNIDKSETNTDELIGRGTDLSAVANYPFSHDALGNTRSNWDCGPIETSPSNLYYSIGQNTTDHKTGSPTLTMSGGLATFSVAQTDTAMGVGDRVTYDTTSIAYIASKVSTTQWNLVTAIGDTPADEVSSVTVNSIAHEYTSLSAAESGSSDGSHATSLRLDRHHYRLHWPCYYDTGNDTSDTDISGWVTTPSSYIKLYTPYDTDTECNTRQRHVGNATSGYQINPSADDDAIDVEDDNVFIEGFLITNVDPDGNNKGIMCDADNITIDACIIYDFDSGVGNCDFIFIKNDQNNIVIRNCVGYDNASRNGFMDYQSTGDIFMYNCTVYGCSSGIGIKADDGTWHLRNCVSFNNSGNDINGSYDSTSSNNRTGDTTYTNANGGGGGDQLTTETATDYFTSATDFHINDQADHADELIDQAVDLSAIADFPFDVDFEEQARITGDWDIGADQHTDTPVAGAAVFYRYYRNRRIG